MEFSCVKDCSQCCIEREYYPTKRFGKIGVLILPEEKQRIESMASAQHLDITILPRIGISYQDKDGPEQIIAYQLMGKEENGNTCPFLDTESDKRSPHGGYVCKIYDKRPLACKAYPLVESSPITLDSKCKFCQHGNTANSNLESEADALIRIKSKMKTDAPVLWRYATGVGEPKEGSHLQRGWIRES